MNSSKSLSDVLAAIQIQRIYRGHSTRNHRDDLEDLCMFKKRIRCQIRKRISIKCTDDTKVGFIMSNRSPLNRYKESKRQAASKIQRAFKEFLVRRNVLKKHVREDTETHLKAKIRLQCFARQILAKQKMSSLRESRMFFMRSRGARLVQSAYRRLLARRRVFKRRYQVHWLAARIIQCCYRSYTAIALVRVIKEKTIALRRFNGAVALQCLARQRMASSRVDILATTRLLYSITKYVSMMQALARGFLVRLPLCRIRLIEQSQDAAPEKLLEAQRLTGLEGPSVKLHNKKIAGKDDGMLRSNREPSLTSASADSVRTSVSVRRPTLALAVSAIITAILSSTPLANVLNVLTLLQDLDVDDCVNEVDEGSGVSALQLASQKGLHDVVRLLLRSSGGAKLEVPSKGVITAMHKACCPLDPATQALPMICLLLGQLLSSPMLILLVGQTMSFSSQHEVFL